MRFGISFPLLVATLFAGNSLPAATPAKSAEVDFHRDVRPILSRHCFKCHGPDDKSRKGGLRLDIPEAAARGGDSGEKALVPGKPMESEFIRRILSHDENELMPPTAAKIALTDAQKQILQRWVAQGAEYKPHWAFVAPKQKPLPQVKTPAWTRNAIDAFVLSRMEAAGLQPSSQADKYTLCRRVYLDLIGLPPTPEEADAFVRDSSPDAYEKLVDRLLQSPHYGERWARRWLDLARYADTNGYEKDRVRSMWPYRDWVINALNADMPFNQFTVEQLAGDLLPKPTREQRIATGFHRNTMINEEGGIDPQEFRFYSLTDRVATTGTAWLGMTVGCAQCHTHKYDPISHTEYYQFLAFLNNVDEPVMDVPQSDVTAKRAEIESQINKLIADLPNRFPVERNYRWSVTKASHIASKSKLKTETLPDGSVFISGTIPEKETTTLTLETDSPQVSAVRLEVLTDPRLPDHGPGYGPEGKFALSEIVVELLNPASPEHPQAIKLVSGFAEEFGLSSPAHHALDGKGDTGWSLRTDLRNPEAIRSVVFNFEKPVTVAAGSKWRVRLDQTSGRKQILGRFRVTLGEETSDPRSTAERRRTNLTKAFNAWDQRETSRAVRWEPLQPIAASANLPILTILSDRSILASSDQTKRDVYDVDYRCDQKGITAICLETLVDDTLPKRGPGRVYYEGPFGDFFLSQLILKSGDMPLRFNRGTQSFATGKSTADKAIDDDPLSGWSIDGGQGESQMAVFNLAEPLAAAGKLHLRMIFERYYAAGMGRFRLLTTTDPRPVEATSLPFDIEQIFLVAREQRTTAQRDRLIQHFLRIAPELAVEHETLRNLRKQMPTQPTTLVMAERPPQEPRTTHLHNRGEFMQPREAVSAGVPAFLPPLPHDASRNRLTFARWLVDPANPLTARVTVNRQWAALFGRGIVKTVEDFGFQGDAPTHPDLLDWLAVEFMNEGWSLKKLHRLVVTSATYRQSSRVTPEGLAKDPQNVWLAHAPRFRLEGELIRDATLRMSGLLATKIGGPSVFPSQPAGVTSEGAYGELAWKTSTGSDRYRRGLYTFAKRTAPFAMLGTFDGPSGEACVARRDVSNTPLQALTLLNDAIFVEAAQALGKTLATRVGTPEEKLDYLFRVCLTRHPEADEKQLLSQFFQAERERLTKRELDAEKLSGVESDKAIDIAAWTLVARSLLNLDETVTRN